MRRVLVLLFLCACPGPSTGPDGGADAGPAPSVTSIDPDHGPAAGGTTITVNGSGFATGATVVFGTTAATAVVFESARKLTATSPMRPQGRASVTVVNPDGRQSTLPNAFLYEGTTTGTIADAVVVNGAAAMDTTGLDPLQVMVKGRVQVPGVTDGVGQGLGVRAQVGFAVDGTTTFSWIDAAFLMDADLYDEYGGAVTLPTPMGMTVATYLLGVRFSVNDGASWVEGDRDGSSNGITDVQRARITVSRRQIDWCKLGGEQISAPETFDLRIGEPGPTIYGQVYALGITDKADAGTGVVGELGVGDAGTDPTSWAWAAATYNHDTMGNANDEFMAVLPTGAAFAGDKRFAFRFGVSGGPWRYCDSDGLTTNGFTEDQAGLLHLSQVGIDQCVLQFPLTLQSRQGVNAGTVYGRVRSRGITEAAGAGAGIEGQLGVGQTATLPTDASWVWAAATYNVEATGGFEEWQSDLIGPAPGTYGYAYRFRYQGGPWTYCDGNVDAPVVLAQLGALTARPTTFKAISECKLQFVSTANVASGDPVVAYGRVRVPGFSEDAGATPGLFGEVGVGTAGTNASTDPAWGWRPAAFNLDVPDSGEDELVATFNPAYSGSRAVSFRFAVDDGGWTYCDLDGTDVGGYSAAQQAPLSVGNASNIDYCVLQFPRAADAGTLVFGQVYVSGVTPAAGADPSISAQLGFGRKIEDPGMAASWTWRAASYNAGCTTCGANNDEYQAALTGAAVGQHYAYRFSRNDGGSYCFADLDGAGIPASFNGDTSGGAENLGVVVP